MSVLSYGHMDTKRCKKVIASTILLLCLLSAVSCKAAVSSNKPLEIDPETFDTISFIKDAEIMVMLSGEEKAFAFATKDHTKFSNLTVSINNKRFKGSETEVEIEEGDGFDLICSADGAIDYQIFPGTQYLVAIYEGDRLLLEKMFRVPGEPVISIDSSTVPESGYELNWTSDTVPSSYDLSIWGLGAVDFPSHSFPGKQRKYRFTKNEQTSLFKGKPKLIKDRSEYYSDESLFTITLTANEYYKFGKIVVITNSASEQSFISEK